jgi:hypothetical protein
MQKSLQDRLNALARAPQNPTKPRNLVTRSGARVRGIHTSKRFPLPLSWETPEERTLIEVLDASPATAALLSQPAQLFIPSEFEPFVYTPDVAVLRTDARVWVIECKPLAELCQPETRLKHAAISMQLLSYDINFLELPNEAQPTAVVMDNLSRISITGSPVQYPRHKREEDRWQIAAHRPDTFRRSRCPRRRPVRGGCTGPRPAAL